MKIIKSIIYVALTLASTVSAAHAQQERSDIRKGNNLYEKGKFTEAEVKFKQAIQKNPSSYEATYNLAGALYKQNRMEEAATQYAKIIEGKDNDNDANTLYNVGNTMVNTRKLDEAIESYKKSLRLNPNDMQTKFNLAYAQKLKEEDDKNKDKNKDQDKDQDKDNKDDNQDKNDKNNENKDDKNKDQDDKKDKNKDDKKNEQEKKQKQQQQKQNQQILDAIQAAEDKTKEKVDKEKAEAYGAGQGNQW